MKFINNVLFLVLILLCSKSIQAVGYTCFNHYSTNKVLPGPIPEFFKQEYIIISMFDFNTYIADFHLKILKNIPKDVKVLVLVPTSIEVNSSLKDIPIQYKELFSKNLFNFESLLLDGRVELLGVPKPNDFNSMKHGNWTRDFISQLVVDSSGKIKFLNFKYHRESADQTDDFVKNFIIKKYEDKLGYKIESLDVPFYFEWGNFTTDGKGNFFISEKVFQINARFNLLLDKAQVSSWIKNIFGKKSKVTWIKSPKNENTGHVDMFMKFLDSKRVLVASTNYSIWKSSLDKIAQMLESKGYEVHRIEMAIDEKEMPAKFVVFRSYTNSLIVGDTVFVPQYDSNYTTLADKDLNARKMYSKLGFRIVKQDSSRSIEDQGAVHCLTSTIPWIFPFIN